MPTYDFECEPCAYYTEIFQKVDDPSILECPVCGEHTLKKVFISAPIGMVRGEPTTVGQQADRNTQKMGRYELQERRRQDEVSRGLTEEKKKRREMHQKIISMTPEQKVRYIEKGE
jgi:putative FmdB family regulatory protein